MATQPQLYFNDVREFFEEKAPDAAACQFCKGGDWNIMYITDNEDPLKFATTYALPIVYSDDEDEAIDFTKSVLPVGLAGVSIIPISCGNCGGMRILDARPLIAWKLAKLEAHAAKPLAPSQPPLGDEEH